MMFVSMDLEADKKTAEGSSGLQRTYEMPGGNTVVINELRFKAPEVMFTPSLLGQGDKPGIQKMIYDTVQESDLDIRKQLYANVILSGGSSLFKNLPERLEKELNILCPKADLVKITAPENRYYSVWQGGNILCGLATFEG